MLWRQDRSNSEGCSPKSGHRFDAKSAWGSAAILWAAFDVTFDKLEETGWGIIFHEDTPQDVRTALGQLTTSWQPGEGPIQGTRLQDGRAGARLVCAPWNRGGHDGARGRSILFACRWRPRFDSLRVPILLGVKYAVGRLAFDTAAEYERYARSIEAYEGSNSVPNAKEIVYWGTHHLGDGATELSSSQLISPLANGIPATTGALKQPLSAQVHYGQKLFAEDDATKAALLGGLHADKPPALLFTASHGMAIASGRPNQRDVQGALLCQDWPSFGSVRPEHILRAADVDDDANVNGMVALMFACFGGGTPDADQFLDESVPGRQSAAARSAPLRRRAPASSAFASERQCAGRHRAHRPGVGLLDPGPNTAGPQIGPFRNGLGQILTGNPVGHALSQQFGAKFAALSATLPKRGLANRATVHAAERPGSRHLLVAA
jgi:hypothetical protein